MRAEGGAAGRRTGNLETKFRAPPLPALPRRLAPRTDNSATHHRHLGPTPACAMSGSSSVTAMKKVVQQLRLEAGLNRVKVSGGGRRRGRGRRRRRRGRSSPELAGAGATRFSWGGRGLGGGDLGAPSFRDQAAGWALWFAGPVSAPFRPRTFQSGLAPGLNSGFPHSGPSSLFPSLRSDSMAGLANNSCSSARRLHPSRPSLPASTVSRHWTRILSDFRFRTNVFFSMSTFRTYSF